MIEKQNVSKAFIARINDSEKLRKCTSGGIATAISSAFINNGGVVVGACFNNNWKVKHSLCKDFESIEEYMGSKYVQSDMTEAFSCINNCLNQGKKVLFVGTPCQVTAIKNIFGDAQDLFTIDFVCRAVPSPKVLEMYLRQKEERYGSNIKRVIFRDKTYGYHNSTMTIEFKNGAIYRKSGRVDEYHKLFFDGLSIRKSCETCRFRTLDRSSDITMFEAWNASRYIPNGKDDNKGYGTILLRNIKGQHLIDLCSKELNLYPADMAKVCEDDGFYLTHMIPTNIKRDSFFSDLNKYGYDFCIDKYVKVTLLDKLFEQIKPILYKYNILVILKKMKSSISRK